MSDLAALAKVMNIDTGCTRVLGKSTIAICGPVGMISADGEVRLRLAALSPLARDSAEELVDAGTFDVAPDGKLFLARLPNGPYEIRLLHRCLGIQQRQRCVVSA